MNPVQYKQYKKNAIILRKSGHTYSEILKLIPVAKSTLSIWLGDVGLSKKQKQKITKKRLEAGKRGGKAKRVQRIERSLKIFQESEKDIPKNLSKEILLIAGTMLYWGEGAKQKEHSPSIGVQFINSNPEMIRFFLKWAKEFLKVKNNRFTFDIYIHKNARNNLPNVLKYWSKQTGFSIDRFDYIYLKKHNPKTKRRNTKNEYHGLLRITIKSSTDLNRKITGWVNGVCKNWGIV